VTGRSETRTLALLTVGVVAVSLAAPLMASLTVPALAIAFWRNALAAAVIAPVVGWRAATTALEMPRVKCDPDAPASMVTVGRWGRSRDLRLVVASGLCLAAHFGFWVSSLRMTSVASSTALVSLQVIWVLGYDLLRGTPINRCVAAGVLAATTGAILVSGVDWSLSRQALVGDALALLGSIAVAAYAVIGGRVRQRLPTSTYTLGCYGIAAAALLVAAAVAGQSLTGYSADQWLGLIVLTATAQLLGHTVFNHLLATVTATVVSLALLLEIPGAALIAAAWLGQVPAPATLVGLLLILVGMVVVVTSTSGPTSPATQSA
jgi:drug/metabolite transporter (DMT)-like permease